MAQITLKWDGLKGAVHGFAAAPAVLDREVYKAVLDSANIARRTIRAEAPGTRKVKSAIKKAIRVRLGSGRGVHTEARVMGAELGSTKESVPGLLASMYERGVSPWAHNSRGIPASDFMGRGTAKAHPIIDVRLVKLGDTVVRSIERDIAAD